MAENIGDQASNRFEYVFYIERKVIGECLESDFRDFTWTGNA